MLIVRIAALLLLAHSLVGWSQIVTAAPATFKLDGDIGEWNPEAAQTGQTGVGRADIWIGQNPQGLIVAGKLDGQFDLASSATELAQKDHLEVWLAETDDPGLPAISFAGNREMEPADCAGFGWENKAGLCLRALGEQPAYRENLVKLFTRMWQLAPGSVAEVWATQAFERLTKTQQKSLHALRPAAGPAAAFHVTNAGFTFEVSIPWEAAPPAGHLHIERLKMAVAMVHAHKRRSLLREAEDSEPGTRITLSSLPLAPALSARFTACEFPLSGAHGEQAYYFMDQKLSASYAFTLQNASESFGIREFGPESLSPNLIEINHSVQPLAPGEVLCWNPLTYRKGNVATMFAYAIEAAAPAQLRLRRLANGVRLIKDGPGTFYREQTYTYCSACPWATFAIYALTPKGNMVKAAEFVSRVDGVELEDYDIELSADWATITEHRQKDDVWTAGKFCLRGLKYEPCGAETREPPPKNRALRLE